MTATARSLSPAPPPPRPSPRSSTCMRPRRRRRVRPRPPAPPCSTASTGAGSGKTFVKTVAGPCLGFALLILVWQLVSNAVPEIPTPAVTGKAALALFSDPFYDNGPNDQGIGWNLLSSLRRVAIGFGLAALVGIPAGFIIGRFAAVSAVVSP